MSKPPSVGWVLWVGWVLASTLGWAVGFPIADAILGRLGEALPDEIVIYTTLGAASGVLQWLLLRRYLPQAGWWVLASTLGGALIGTAASNARIVDPVGGLVVAGASFGILQWLVLRRHIARAGWWLLASPAGWAVSAWAVRAADRAGVFGAAERAIHSLALRMSDTVVLALVFGVFGASLGALTGVVMVWLMRNPIPEASRHLSKSS